MCLISAWGTFLQRRVRASIRDYPFPRASACGLGGGTNIFALSRQRVSCKCKIHDELRHLSFFTPIARRACQRHLVDRLEKDLDYGARLLILKALG